MLCCGCSCGGRDVLVDVVIDEAVAVVVMVVVVVVAVAMALFFFFASNSALEF